MLDPSVVFLNHGSFGAVPRPVFEAQERLRRELEAEPVLFLARRPRRAARRGARGRRRPRRRRRRRRPRARAQHDHRARRGRRLARARARRRDRADEPRVRRHACSSGRRWPGRRARRSGWPSLPEPAGSADEVVAAVMRVVTRADARPLLQPHHLPQRDRAARGPALRGGAPARDPLDRRRRPRARPDPARPRRDRRGRVRRQPAQVGMQPARHRVRARRGRSSGPRSAPRSSRGAGAGTARRRSSSATAGRARSIPRPTSSIPAALAFRAEHDWAAVIAGCRERLERWVAELEVDARRRACRGGGAEGAAARRRPPRPRRPRARQTCSGCSGSGTGSRCRSSGSGASPWFAPRCRATRATRTAGRSWRRSARSTRPEGTITSGQRAWWARSWPTEPSRSRFAAPRPREPTTSRSAPSDCSSRTVPGRPSSATASTAVARPHLLERRAQQVLGMVLGLEEDVGSRREGLARVGGGGRAPRRTRS